MPMDFVEKQECQMNIDRLNEVCHIIKLKKKQLKKVIQMGAPACIIANARATVQKLKAERKELSDWMEHSDQASQFLDEDFKDFLNWAAELNRRGLL